MAGAKGRSGGARKNSGGARPGAGRPAKEKPLPVPVPPETSKVVEGQPLDPRPALEQIALGMLEVNPQQFKALISLLPYVHQKLGEGGKKEQREDAAKKVASRFATGAPPKLVASGGKKLS
jgi:phage terminase small subunit